MRAPFEQRTTTPGILQPWRPTWTHPSLAFITAPGCYHLVAYWKGGG